MLTARIKALLYSQEARSITAIQVLSSIAQFGLIVLKNSDLRPLSAEIGNILLWLGEEIGFSALKSEKSERFRAKSGIGEREASFSTQSARSGHLMLSTGFATAKARQ